MNCNDSYFFGNWRLNNRCRLNIEKTGDIYKCVWKINDINSHNEYIGIGILIDGQLHISKFPINSTSGGGVCLYSPTDDLNSMSALWASSNNLGIIGSGIAIRKDSNKGFEGNYSVKYFINGEENADFDLDIVRKKDSKTYSLLWTIEDNIISQGIGFISDEKMVVAWGGIEVECELTILSYLNESELTEKLFISASGDFIYSRYFKYS